MSTRSIKNWESTPGNIDCLNTEYLFEITNNYGIPNILPEKEIPKDLIMYGTEVRRSYAQTRGKTVHFFLDDYKFEPLWNKPIKTLQPILNIGSALSPDFSLYTDYPMALQIYNVYRNRWLGRFWQENGVKVIPTIAWSDKRIAYLTADEAEHKMALQRLGWTVVQNVAEIKSLITGGK